MRTTGDIIKRGKFKLHSGQESEFKFDLDKLSDADIANLAYLITHYMPQVPKFYYVMGVPTGGLRLENALEKYTTSDSEGVLIVDDVFTTGKSIEEVREDWILEGIPRKHIFGVVLLARQKPPKWVVPVFQFTGKL